MAFFGACTCLCVLVQGGMTHCILPRFNGLVNLLRGYWQKQKCRLHQKVAFSSLFWVQGPQCQQQMAFIRILIDGCSYIIWKKQKQTNNKAYFKKQQESTHTHTAWWKWLLRSSGLCASIQLSVKLLVFFLPLICHLKFPLLRAALLISHLFIAHIHAMSFPFWFLCISCTDFTVNVLKNTYNLLFPTSNYIHVRRERRVNPLLSFVSRVWVDLSGWMCLLIDDLCPPVEPKEAISGAYT